MSTSRADSFRLWVEPESPKGFFPGKLVEAPIQTQVAASGMGDGEAARLRMVVAVVEAIVALPSG